MKKEIMSLDRLNNSLAISDLTNPQNGIHAVNLVIRKIEIALEEKYLGAKIEQFRFDPIVSVKANFDDLLFPADNLGRSSRYTRYVTEDSVLRTHTSSGIPYWLDQLNGKTIDDTIVILPGMCYRRDIVDKNHCGEPHQMDVWRIKYGTPYFDRSDLVDLIETILNSVVPGCKYKMNEVNHPYTLRGLEIEVLVNGAWLEILECGEAHPSILESYGYNSVEYSGLALGMGLDRLVMIIKNINDIRILRSRDPRIKCQMDNLDEYVVVSDQPPTKRVLSYSTSVEKTEEDVCEDILDGLKQNAIFLEKIDYSEVLYEQLSEKAKNNLGIYPDQKNVVVELTFRSLEKSLPKKTVNQWMQDLYPILNQGVKGYM